MVKNFLFGISFAALLIGCILLSPIFMLCLWTGNFEGEINEKHS